ncbi:DUF349 domain-containing protein [Roseivirga sp. BDSF3-8]|uniref:DUF349 domain-containing protein n=1 Tax=Roseivirga sp. BDSF3-8 TaxID=3241598 RepID=UPI003531F99D
MMNTEKSNEEQPEKNTKQEEQSQTEIKQETPSSKEESQSNETSDLADKSSEMPPMHSSEIEAATEGSENNPDVSETPSEEDKVDMSVASASLASTGDEVKKTEGEASAGSPPESAGDSDKSDDENHADEEDEDHEEVDYSKFSKAELANEMENLARDEQNMRKIDRRMKDVRAAYDDIHNHERDEARKKFVEEGGDEADFDYRPDDDDNRFEASFQLLKDRRHQYYQSLEKQKDTNLQKKVDLIEKLRELVDSDETNTSMEVIKNIQQEWKAIGPIPGQHVKTTWANYNALMDRFYDNRSIYYELKELDRRKNLTAKLELCAKAEALLQKESIKEAVKELNELHEEFKHIGPVPKEEQEAVWQRFKGASDAVYAKRKVFVEQLKKDLGKNLGEKEKLGTEVQEFATFDSDRINEWNAKTKEILALQKKWDSVGGLPRDRAKEINKNFWSGFKTFFSNKNHFFKKLEGQREENLKKKEELVARAEEIKDSDDWDATANELKGLQRKWKEIGPVPEKVRDEVYHKFKAACDTFFENRRNRAKEAEKDYYENLEAKRAICDKINALAGEDGDTKEAFNELVHEYAEIGFVPKENIKSIQKKFADAVDKYVESTDTDELQREKLRLSAQIQKMKGQPNAGRKIHKRENAIRRQISELENNISLWKNNMEFFAQSRTADKLKQEMEDKVQSAQQEVKALKMQLRMLREAE